MERNFECLGGCKQTIWQVGLHTMASMREEMQQLREEESASSAHIFRGPSGRCARTMKGYTKKIGRKKKVEKVAYDINA